MDKKQLPVLGIDLGGTKISAALVVDNRLVGEPKRVPTPKGPDKIVEALLALTDDFRKEHLIIGLGIATAGIVDPDSGQILGSTGNLPGWEGTPLKKILQSKTALRTHVENDANASAVGEVYASPALTSKKCVVAVTLGTGIGVGIVIDGEIYRGGHFAAGESGHMKVAMDNRRRCTCGLWDCWEAYGAGRGLVATGWQMLDGVEGQQSPLVGKRDTLTTADITSAAKSGDLLAAQMMEQWHLHVACGLVTLCHTLDPDAFVITGGMSQFVDYAMLRDMVADRIMPRFSEKLAIKPSILGETGGMIGAAALVVAQAERDEHVPA